MTSAVRIALVYPDLLGTYGDSGNATVLAERLRWRGHEVEVCTVLAGQVAPEGCDLYVVGGGEDLPQALAAKDLGRPGPLQRAVDGGAVVLAVCAGLQIIGESFVGPDGVETAGLGLVDIRSVRGDGPRAVGELVVDAGGSDGPGVLTGYENHGGRTLLGPGVAPAGRVRSGVGNGHGLGADGVRSERVWGTYLHGPVLARNPALADLLLSWVVGDLAPLDDTEEDRLRAERLAAAAEAASVGRAGRRTGARLLRRGVRPARREDARR